MRADPIDAARKAVAIAMAIFGVGLVVCIQRDDYLTGTLRHEPGIWRWGAWAFGSGIAACLLATFVLVIEYLARPVTPSRFVLRSFLMRASMVLIAIVGVGCVVAFVVGFGQRIGAAIGASLSLAALRERHEARVALAVLAAVAFGLTIWSAQSANQHQDEKRAEQRAACPPQLAFSIQNQ